MTVKEQIRNVSEEELSKITSTSTSYAEVIRKITGQKDISIGSKVYKYLKERLAELKINTSHITGQSAGQIKRNKDNIFCKDSTAVQETLRNAYKQLDEIPYECACCHNPGEWNGKPLTLQLEHKNGDKHDNRLENLCWICPTCHSMTDTFCGRNISSNEYEKCPSCSNVVKRGYAKSGLCYKCERKMHLLISNYTRDEIISRVESLSKQYAIGLDFLRSTIIPYSRKSAMQKAYANKRSSCPQCGSPMSRKASLCLECYNKSRNNKIPDSAINIDLISRILSSSFAAVARELGVSDNAIRKRLSRVGIPVKRDEMLQWYEEQTGRPPVGDSSNSETRREKNNKKKSSSKSVRQSTLSGQVVAEYPSMKKPNAK